MGEPALIAEIYAEYSKPLAKEAHIRGLRDAEEGYKSMHSTNEDGEPRENENTERKRKKKNKEISDVVLKQNQKQKFQTKISMNEDNKTQKTKSSQRKTQPRRSLIDRRYGDSELSPFVFRLDGTITFRKPELEKLKRKQ